MNKLKVMTVVGTRPEIIRLSAVIKACDKYFNHILIHTGQNWDYTLNEVFFKDLELREPNYYLNSVGKNLGETMGNPNFPYGGWKPLLGLECIRND
jgi:UDP-N-acetylglucosamine 2-epimerase (non-hydrolysing)